MNTRRQPMAIWIAAALGLTVAATALLFANVYYHEYFCGGFNRLCRNLHSGAGVYGHEVLAQLEVCLVALGLGLVLLIGALAVLRRRASRLNRDGE